MPDLPSVAAVDCHDAAVTDRGQQPVQGLQLDTCDHITDFQLDTCDNAAGLQLDMSDHHVAGGLKLETSDHQVAGIQLETSDHHAAGGLQLDEWSAVHAVDTKCYAAVTPAAAENEDRVMEALGISNKVRHNASLIVLGLKNLFFSSHEKMFPAALCTMKTSQQIEQGSTNISNQTIYPCGLMT